MTEKLRIQAPSNVITINGQDKQFFIFEGLMVWAINGDKRFNQDGPGIRASVRIETELAKLPPIAKEDQTQEPRFLVLKQEDQALLLDSLVNPQQMNGGGYPLTPARVLLPWIDAVENAIQ
ncbi:MAG: hypothetical protein ABFD89_17760 [Bryobacteraceae bacterium]